MTDTQNRLKISQQRYVGIFGDRGYVQAGDRLVEQLKGSVAALKIGCFFSDV